MAHPILHDSRGAAVWALAAKQHGVVTRQQLLDLGFSPEAVKHRVAKRRLHPVRRGVYAVGRPQLTRHGVWMAAVLSCGPEAALCAHSAAALWEIRPDPLGDIEVLVPAVVVRRQTGIRVMRRRPAPGDIVCHHRISVTSPIHTLIDLAATLRPNELEAAVNEADKRDLVDPETLRAALDGRRGRRGVPALRRILDMHTFTLTDSELERLFLPLARRAGLPPPQTRERVNGVRVDFYWPQLGLVVETDGLRYHRTPAQQAADRRRDQAHLAAGLTALRFTHAQVAYEGAYVVATLAAVAAQARTVTPSAAASSRTAGCA